MSRLSTDPTSTFADSLPASADELQAVLSAERQHLKRSLDQLGSAVREKVNVRSQLREHPLVTVGAAFAGGLLLGMLSKRVTRPEERSGSDGLPITRRTSPRPGSPSALGHMASTIAALVGQRLASVAEDTVRDAITHRRNRA